MNDTYTYKKILTFSYSLHSRMELTTFAHGAHCVRAWSSLRSLTDGAVFFCHFSKHLIHTFFMIMMPTLIKFNCSFIQSFQTYITFFSFHPFIPHFIYFLHTITRRTILMYPFKYIHVSMSFSPSTCIYIPWTSITSCPNEAF